MNFNRISLSIAVLAVIVAAWMLYPMLLGGSSVVADKDLQQIVHVDRETGKAFLVRARLSPEVNPETGKRTLIPGMYCEKCKAWKPVGPIELLQTQRSIHKCPTHKIPLLRDGPFPETASR